MTQGRYNIPLVPDIVPRQRLLTLFDRHESCRVFLLTGQAAQGKSTLVASFLKGQEQPSLWCHLTAEASDHTRLFEILINGIHELFREQEQIQKIQIPQTTLGTREDLFRQIETLAMSFLKEKKYALAKEAALMAVNELGVSKRGDIHYFLAKQIHGFSLFYTGDFVAAQRELEAVLAYFSRISSDLYFCETSFILGLICLGIKAENKDKDKNSEQTYLNVGISKAMGNQYTYFPLLDLKTLAQVLVQINLIPSGRALSPGTIENQDLASYFVEDPYLEWLGPRRDLFRSKYIEILKKKGLLHEEMDQWSEAVDTWRVILGTDPFFEAAYRNLMILYADAGRKSEALHVFKECRGILNRELDTEPEFQTQQIYARIKKL